MGNTRTQLRLGLYVGEPAPPGRHGVGVLRGQPLHLLGWLEAQLGLVGRPASQVERIAQYSARLEKVENAAWSASRSKSRRSAKRLIGSASAARFRSLSGW